jgi:hypothetical protein
VIRCGIEQGKNYDHIQNKKVVNVWEIPQEFVPTAMIASIQGMRRGVLKNLIIPQPEFNEVYFLMKMNLCRNF